MTTLGDALVSVAGRGAIEPTRPEESIVVAIIRLAENGRAWFITSVSPTSEGMRVDGYEPGCEYSDERWFQVSSDFFEIAARANQDRLIVQVLDEPIPLAALEDSAF